MSKSELKVIASTILSGLIGRGLIPEVAKTPRIQIGETDGHWCQIADIGHGILDIWLDKWRSRNKLELYYGYWSKTTLSTQRVRSIFCDEEDCSIIKREDETEIKATLSNNITTALRVEKSSDTTDRFLLHLTSDTNWFGRYSQADVLAEMTEEAIMFFDQVLREASQGQEGALRTLLANRYERDPALRAAAIRIHGCSCAVCDMNFEQAYGTDLGKGFIHVHHLTPLSVGRGTRKVDPKTDLRPVCPNCHAMIHRRNPPIDPNELRKLI